MIWFCMHRDKISMSYAKTAKEEEEEEEVISRLWYADIQTNVGLVLPYTEDVYI